MKADTSPILLTGVRIVDGTGAPARSNQAVLIERGRIKWIGPADNAPEVGSRNSIACGDRTLLPGLINSHVHLSSDASADFAAQAASDSIPMAALRAGQMAIRTLRAGVTTVRDCGATGGIAIELGRAIESGLVEGPRVLAAGRVITMTGGHGHFIGHEADGPDAVRRATRVELKGGADFIKVMATGGVLTRGVDPAHTSLQPEELAVVATEAHNAGKRVASHAIGNAGIRNALEAGIDSIEHGIHLDDGTLQLALDKGAFLVPTLLAVARIIEAGVESGVPDWVVEKAKRESDRSRGSFVAAVRSGLRIAAGTDAGTPYNWHEDLGRELELMVEYGLTPMQAIVAATKNAAVNLDIEHRVGTVEEGKLADLILVEGRPDENISSVTDVRLVMKEGVVYRNELPRLSLTELTAP